MPGKSNIYMNEEQIEKAKVAVVTGAGRGIGRAIAESLARQEMKVICVSKTEGSCGAAAEAIREAGGDASALPVDVSSGEEIRKACEELLQEHECVDVLVNNAGITRDNLLFRMGEEDWNDVINTNLTSCFHWIKMLGRPMTRKRWGRIVNISSVVGLTGNAGQANYAAAKAGMIGLTKSLAREFAARSVTVNAIAPGFFPTELTVPVFNDSERTIRNAKQTCIGRNGDLQDLNGPLLFLCSKSSDYVTGQLIFVDGGFTAK